MILIRAYYISHIRLKTADDLSLSFITFVLISLTPVIFQGVGHRKALVRNLPPDGVYRLETR